MANTFTAAFAQTPKTATAVTVNACASFADDTPTETFSASRRSQICLRRQARFERRKVGSRFQFRLHRILHCKCQ